jgi:agmatine/peptidylarginine deiminase
MNRGFGFTDGQISELLGEYFGIRRWIYVPPLEGEPTGHVDMFAAVLAKNVAVVGELDPSIDSVNSERLDLSASHISKSVSSLGPMKVLRIPMPPKWGNQWRSYTNVILANGILLMPSYSDVDPELEDRAEQVYREALPGWEVKRIPCDELVKDEGQLHCLSYNVPRYVSIEPLLEKAGVKAPSLSSSNHLLPGTRKPPFTKSVLLPAKGRRKAG